MYLVQYLAVIIHLMLSAYVGPWGIPLSGTSVLTKLNISSICTVWDSFVIVFTLTNLLCMMRYFVLVESIVAEHGVCVCVCVCVCMCVCVCLMLCFKEVSCMAESITLEDNF
jgi:hypothetical protein